MEPVTQVTYRRAVMSDYQAVLAITESYPLDYLPAYYHTWCHSRLFHPLVGEKSGKIVSFFLIGYTDKDGKTCTGSAGRVATNELATGEFVRLKIESNKIAKEVGCAHRLLTVLRGPDNERAVQNYLSRGNRIVHSSRTSGYAVSCSAIRCREFPQGDITSYNIKPLSICNIDRYAGEIQRILGKEGDAFLPGQAWLPLWVTSENIRYAASMSAMFAGFKPENDPNESDIISVSFCCVMPVKDGVRMMSVLYSASVAECEAHMRAHLKHLGQIATSGYCEIMLYHPMGVDCGALEKNLASLLGPREKLTPSDRREMTVMWLEL